MNSRILIILSTLFWLASCKHEEKKLPQMQNQITGMVLPEWAKDAVIYEVNIRQYTKEGTFNSFSDHIPRLKAMGVDIIWIMPVFPISKTKRKGTLGSYYAVSDFKSANPEFGTMEDLTNLIEKIHAYKMRVILDWVPNHTGWDHAWIKSHPEFYTRDKNGNLTDPLDGNGNSMGWTDVADLNYNVQAMRDSMINELLHWVKVRDVDGFRMDIAWGVPMDFWKLCSSKLLEANKDLLLVAEADHAEHLNEGSFHVCYGWKLHHTMNEIANGKANVKAIVDWLHYERSKFQRGSVMHFISNHDENSWQGSEFERMGDAYRTFAVLTMTLDGIPLIYSGQEEPLKRKLQFFEKDLIDFRTFENMDFYTTLCQLKHQEPAMWNEPYGARAEIISNSDRVFAFKRETDKSKVVVILNLSSETVNESLNEDVKNMLEVFKKGSFNYSKGDNLELKPWEYLVLINK